MICSSCGKEIPDGKKFCKYCGAPTVRKCKNCGAPLDSDALFCDECGARCDMVISIESEEIDMPEADENSNDISNDTQSDFDNASDVDMWGESDPRCFDEEDDFDEDYTEVSNDKKLAFENANLDCVIIPRSIAESKDAAEISGWFRAHADEHCFAVEYGTRIIRCLTAQPDKDFSECINIEKIVIPDTVKIIGKMAFFGCISLKKIVIPNSVTTIGHNAFYYCRSLTEIHIPDSVKRIGNGAFYLCSPNIRLYISDLSDLYWIGDLYFNYKEQNSDEQNDDTELINNRVEKIFINDEEFSFLPSSSLDSVPSDELDEWINSNTNGQVIMLYANWHILHSKLYKKVIIPELNGCIPEHAFSGCESLTEVYLPNSVKHTSIGESAFAFCSALRRINIPNSATFIGNSAFNGCSSLTEINIPDSVTEIQNNAFSYCDALKRINIPNSVTYIGDNAFSHCSSLTQINIPNSVTAISMGAFAGCDSLTEINIQNSVTYIGNSAFNGCSSLTEINIPNSVTYIGNSAFNGCSSLTEINIPNSVTAIGEYAFSECCSLTELNIPDSVTSIGDHVCYLSTSLRKLSIPCIATASNVFIGMSFYPEPLILKEIRFTGKQINADIKELLSNLPCSESIILPDGLQDIPDDLFESYKLNRYDLKDYRGYVKKVTIPYSVVHIGNRAFSGCSELEVNIPESVVSIGAEAFRNCGKGVIRIPQYVNNIGANAFAGSKVDISNCDLKKFKRSWLSGAEVCSPVSYSVVKELYSDSNCNIRFSNITFPKISNDENAATDRDEIITSAGAFMIEGQKILCISANGEKISANIYGEEDGGNINTNKDGFCGRGWEIKSLSFTAALNYVFVNKQKCTYSCYTCDANVMGGFITSKEYDTPNMYCEVYDFSSSNREKVFQKFSGKLVKSVRTQNNGEIVVQFDNGESAIMTV